MIDVLMSLSITFFAIAYNRWIQKGADKFTAQWQGIVHVVEDTSVVDVALADLSSTKVGTT